MNEANLSRLEDLILARVSVRTKNRPTLKEVSDSLHHIAARRFTKLEWDLAFAHALESLRGAGLIERNKLALTRSGMERLQLSLGSSTAPIAKDWRTFKVKYLPRLLFASLASKEVGSIKPSVALLAQRLDVPYEAKSTASNVLDAWLRLTLRLPPNKTVSIGLLRAALLARELGLPAPSARRTGSRRADAVDEVTRLAAARLSEAPNGTEGAVTDALIVSWLLECNRREAMPSAQAQQASPPDSNDMLERVAAKVLRVAEEPQVRQFGPDKVFIGSVWRALQDDPEIIALGELEFKRVLVEAHRRGLILLSRADLVAAMDPMEVRASETTYQNATYHFVQRGASA